MEKREKRKSEWPKKESAEERGMKGGVVQRGERMKDGEEEREKEEKRRAQWSRIEKTSDKIAI